MQNCGSTMQRSQGWFQVFYQSQKPETTMCLHRSLAGAKDYNMEREKVKKSKYEIDMCSGSIMDKLISFSLPLIYPHLQLMFNAVDIVVVGEGSWEPGPWRQRLDRPHHQCIYQLLLSAFLWGPMYWPPCSGKERDVGDGPTSITLALISGIVSGSSRPGLFGSCPGVDGDTGGCDETVRPLYAHLLYGYAVFYAVQLWTCN